MVLGAAFPFSLSLDVNNISKLLLISGAEQWFSTEVNFAFLPPGDVCQCLQTFLIILTRQGGTAKCPTMYRTASHNKELSSLKCQ